MKTLKRACIISIAYAAVDLFAAAIYWIFPSLSIMGINKTGALSVIYAVTIRIFFGIAVGRLTAATLLEIASAVTVALIIVTGIRSVVEDWGVGILSSDWWLLVLIGATTLVLVLFGCWLGRQVTVRHTR